MLNKVYLLLWKNLILRRRYYIITTFEILLPILCIAFLIIIKILDYNPTTYRGINQTIFDVQPEDTLKKSFCKYLDYTCDSRWANIMAYAPDNEETRQVIQKVQGCIMSSSESTKYKWMPFTTIKDFDSYLAKEDNKVDTAILFEKGLGKSIGNRISYKIRMSSILVSSTPDTHFLFPKLQVPGPFRSNAVQYFNTGFIGLQMCIDKALVEKLSGRTASQTVSLQPFPYQPYPFTLEFSNVYYRIFSAVATIAFIFIIPSTTRAVVSENETGIKELLKLKGLGVWIQWLGSMINSMLVLMITVTIVVFLLFVNIGPAGGAFFQHSDFTVWWFVLMLYVMSATSFFLFISSFFTNPKYATTVGIAVWITVAANLLLDENFDDYSLAFKLSLTLFPSVAIHMAITGMSSFEARAIGIHWTNLHHPINENESLCVGHIILIFLLNTFLFMLLTIYMENVIPSKFGVRKSWNYIFQRETYFKRKELKSYESVSTSDDEGQFGLGEVYTHSRKITSAPGFEEDPPSNVHAVVDIKNLRKHFGEHNVAVDELSVKIYDTEIFALCGENGCGKTTIISILTGMFAPSSGTVLVNGHDVVEEFEMARGSLGLCPQHNLLFDRLTALEHLRFFGQLNGLSESAASRDAKNLLQKLQLADKENTLSMHLSGGEKRKLSVGIALIGEPRLVILDDPTSGMDPQARRAVWDLLLDMRGKCTILLTTHSMEEADALGDRIGIMVGGKLHCCGSPTFLKKYFGTGYTLTLPVSETANHESILQLVKNHIPNAVKVGNSASSSEIVLISIPTESASTSILSQMFTDLTKEKDQLGIIKTIGLSLTTINDVFLRVGQLTNANEGTVTDSLVATDEITEKARLVGLKLVLQQWRALLIKKMIYTYRNWKLVTALPLLWIIYLTLLNYPLYAFIKPKIYPPPLKITLESYTSPVTLAFTTSASDDSRLQDLIGSSYVKVPTGTSLQNALLEKGASNLADYREKYIVALNVTSTNVHAMFNTIPNHAAPLAINIASNFLLRILGSSKEIVVTNHPIDYGKQNQNDISAEATIYFIISMLVRLIALIAASLIVFPVQERKSKSKHLQMMTGVNPVTYWYSSFLWDYLLVMLTVCLVTLIFFPILQESSQGVGIVFVVLLFFGFSALSFSYLISLYPTTSSGGVLIVFIADLIGTVLVTISLTSEELGSAPAIISKWIGFLFPAYGAEISALLGIGLEFYVMVIMSFFYQAIWMMHEFQLFQRFFGRESQVKKEKDGIDEDVKVEADRVAELIRNGKTEDDALVVENLSKNFGTHAIVSNLNFGVHHGECFGFLGVNGCGKTTTFRMLTGDEPKSFGNAYSLGYTLTKNKKRFLSNIGYCPQFGGLIGVMSGRQMLQLYARLRGLPENLVNIETDKWLLKMGLRECADVQCENYSGGMKRKLSVAIALMGDPSLLILDEPTSGVDPISRRRLWNIFLSLRSSCQSIIFTSHSMEECEEICSRLSIMVNGQLQCVGDFQHLKQKFANGYSLAIRLKFDLSEDSREYRELANLKYEVLAKFHPCTWIDIHMNVCLFHLHDISLTWDVVFKDMEDVKRMYINLIEDYSLKETTLEEVFLTIARRQVKVEESRLIKCKCC